MQQLLGPDDPPPFSVHNETGKAQLLLLCDHASRAVPKALGSLGISEAELAQHIGWDIGGLDAAVELSRQLDRMTANGRKVCMLVMHSFTPEMKGFKRPWHVGVLWNDDPSLPEPLLAELRRDASLVVGDNEPYSARASYEYTLTAHARSRALPHCSLEVRQDLMATPDDARAWGRRLAPAIRSAVAVALRQSASI